MKRLYVRPEARGRGVGKRLALDAIEFASAANYACIRLDTLESMTTAQRLYRELGFKEIPPYRHNPISGASFFELRLKFQ
jgi:ribosomal protein S18 acetylase RimI-like enzyme